MANDPERRAWNQRAMQSSQMEALAAFSPVEILLLTGYWPVIGPGFAIAHRSGEVIAAVPEDELELAQATSGARFFPYNPASLDHLSPPVEQLSAAVQQLSKQLPIEGGRLGLTCGDGMQPAPYLSTHHLRDSVEAVLSQAYPSMEIVAADDLFTHLRAIKTSMELNQIRRACQLAASGFEAAAHAIQPGRREDEIVAEAEAAFLRAALSGFERSDGSFFCMSGPNSVKAAGAYARTRTRMVEAGDLAMIHANTVGDGYWTDITRTYVAGHALGLHRRMREAIAEARAAAFAAIRPGAAAAEIDAAARNVLVKHGFGEGFKHSTGHGVGFAAANPNAIPRIHPKSPDRLEAGMVFNIEPAIYIEGVGGIRHCDVVACTESGYELLTPFEWDQGA